MAQVIVYGRRASLDAHRDALSDAIHAAVVTALDYPQDKRFHRFIGLDERDFIYPKDRGDDYTVIEISMFGGRSAEAKRTLIAEIFTRVEAATGIPPHSVEITITETPRANWGIRGAIAEDLALSYHVEV